MICKAVGVCEPITDQKQKMTLSEWPRNVKKGRRLESFPPGIPGLFADATFSYTVFGRAHLELYQIRLFVLGKIIFKENMAQRRFSAEQVAEMLFADSDESENGSDPDRFDSEEEDQILDRIDPFEE